MYVKIKLESENSKAPFAFNIDNSATIFDLKCRLQEYTGISADLQEVHTLAKELNNNDILSNVVEQYQNVQKINGVAISLYSSNEFVCFVQFYTEKEGNEQTRFFNQPDTARRLPIDKMPKYCEIDIDSSESCDSTTSESSDTSSSNSSTVSKEDENVKRKRAEKCEPQVKRVCVGAQEADCQPSGQRVEIDEPARGECTSSVSTPVAERTVNTSSPSLGLNRLPEPAPYEKCCPEKRKYALVISNGSSSINQLEYDQVMAYYYELFKSSQSSGRLRFSDESSVLILDGVLWVHCEDQETYEWIAKGAQSFSPYKCIGFIEHFGLIKCSTVLPHVGKNKDMISVFELLEMQNEGVSTGKWCVGQRKLLERNAEKAVSGFCENEQLTLYVDADSKKFIQNQYFKLKYCFWKLTFEF